MCCLNHFALSDTLGIKQIIGLIRVRFLNRIVSFFCLRNSSRETSFNKLCHNCFLLGILEPHCEYPPTHSSRPLEPSLTHAQPALWMHKHNNTLNWELNWCQLNIQLVLWNYLWSNTWSILCRLRISVFQKVYFPPILSGGFARHFIWSPLKLLVSSAFH